MDLCYFIDTKEESARCIRCGYFKTVTPERDEAGNRIKTEYGYRLRTSEIATPYGMLRIQTTDKANRYLPIESKEKLNEIYKFLLEIRDVIHTAKIHRFEDGTFKIIDVFHLMQSSN